jgi:hypothetical protein
VLTGGDRAESAVNDMLAFGELHWQINPKLLEYVHGFSDLTNTADTRISDGKSSY